MTKRNWTGNAGYDDAGNPSNWGPYGAPQPGDDLYVDGPGPGTILNVSGNELLNAHVYTGNPGYNHSLVTINLTDNAWLWQCQYPHGGIWVSPITTTINVFGTDTVNTAVADGFRPIA